MTIKNFCFTSFLTEAPLAFQAEKFQYLIYQTEEAPTTKKKHYQGYAELYRKTTIKKAKELIGDLTAHIEQRKGTQEQAINYCKKSNSQVAKPLEFGTPAQQGRRTDISKLIKLTPSEIIAEDPMFFLKYHKGIEKVQQLAYKPELRLNIAVIAIIGNPGSGKTRYIYDNHKIEDIYKLNTNTNGTL